MVGGCALTRTPYGSGYRRTRVAMCLSLQCEGTGLSNISRLMCLEPRRAAELAEARYLVYAPQPEFFHCGTDLTIWQG